MNILLICSAGMSTSLLVKRMEEAAEARGEDVKIWAVGSALAKNNVGEADIILLGPQVRYLKNQISEMVNNAKPVECVDMKLYGTVDGAGVLDFALKLLEN